MKKDFMSDREFGDWLGLVGRLDDFSLARCIDLLTAELYRRQAMQRALLFASGGAELQSALQQQQAQASQQQLAQDGGSEVVQR